MVNEHMSLGELAAAAGLPARTVRFYIARGLVAGPAKSGRGAVYTAAHLARLEWIKELQSQGRTLAEIGAIGGGQSPEVVPEPTAWWQHAVADDVVVWVRAGAAPWRTRQIRKWIDQLARQLAQANDEPGKEQDP
ncbi:MAG: MerR family transcriptional regulator [Bryobacterales bacterium]|nr:MerR family transcriptional regulator [Bryobacterales bacterium]